jgi:anti-sigma regulatory factor (Ser/Thr protein kinase)
MKSRPVKDDLGDVGPAIEWAGRFVDKAGLSPDVRFAVDLSLEEALANLIMHGHCASDEGKDIVLAVATDASGATVTIQDRCAPFDVTAHHAEEDAAAAEGIGGRGLKLLRSFVSELSYATKGDQNTLTMRFAAA